MPEDSRAGETPEFLFTDTLSGMVKAGTREPESRRREWLPAVLLAVVFVVKLVVALQFDRHPLLQPDTGLDTTAYTELARGVAGGDLALGPGLYSVSPLYIYFLAAIYVVGRSFTAARIVQAVLGTAAVALIFSTTRLWFGRRAAWFAAVLAALSGLFTYYEALLLQSALDPFLTALALWLFTVGWQRERARLMLLAGIVFGIAALNRPNMLLAAAGLALVMFVARRRQASLLLIVGLLAGVAPVAVRNLVVAHQWSLVSSQGGINFYIGNGEGATGYFHAVPRMRSTVEGLANDARREAERATGRRMTDGETSAYFTQRAFMDMRVHPVAWLRVLTKKVYGIFNTAHVSTPFSYPFYAWDTTTPLRILLLGPWLLVPLGLFGMLRTRTPLAWFALSYAGSVVLFFITERYKLPLFVALTMTAGAGLDLLLLSKRRTRDGCLVAVLLLFCNWPLGLDDGRGEERTRMAEYHAARAELDPAERWTKLALEKGTDAATVEIRVASQFLNAGQPVAAVSHLQHVTELKPDDSSAHYLLGKALLASGRPAEAVPHLERAIHLVVNAPLAPYDLAVALQESGESGRAVVVLRTVVLPPDASAEVWIEFGKRAGLVGAPDLAEHFLRGAVERAPHSAEAHALLGVALMELQRYGEAASELEASLREQPRNADVLAMLSVAQAELHRDRDAWQNAKKALELRPKHPVASRALQILIARGVTAASMP
jgi:Flp pilus assembly protein TadD/4-amino-4-deoxy-L-arabinose transferase-like glycosyltransferase